MRRILLSLMTSVLAIAGLVIPTAGPAMAADWRLLEHVCKVVGSDSLGNQGVHCIDIYDLPFGEGWKAENSIYCQKADRTLLNCRGIKETPGICTSGKACRYGAKGVCGTWYGHSACGVRKVRNTAPVEEYNHPCGSYRWGITVDTTIVLPDSLKEVGGVGTSLRTSQWSGC
ncbi:hypothetical protein [Paractinoplanes atraurantiacus]|nr:hypothetical protein [Actinoplanes atraurantiacus]